MQFNTFKYHVFASMGIFQLELINLYLPPTVENKGKLILYNSSILNTNTLMILRGPEQMLHYFRHFCSVLVLFKSNLFSLP